MKDLNFQLACVDAELPAIQLDKGKWLFHAHLTCEFADLATNDHAARWIGDNVPPKWKLEFKRADQKGRPAMYLLLPGFLYVLTMGNSEIALKFRDEVFENILPAIVENGGYISDSATPEQLEALQTKITILQDENMLLKQHIDDEPQRLRKAKQDGIKQVTDETIKKVAASAECFTDDSNGNPIIQNRYLKDENKKLKNTLADKQKQLARLEYAEKEIKKILTPPKNKKMLKLNSADILGCFRKNSN
jgi:prophage antirepressor-like protein